MVLPVFKAAKRLFLTENCTHNGAILYHHLGMRDVETFQRQKKLYKMPKYKLSFYQN